MSRTARRRSFGALVAALLVAHAFAPSRAGAFPGLGPIPFDLGYHLVWTAVAAAAVVFLCTAVWEDET